MLQFLAGLRRALALLPVIERVVAEIIDVLDAFRKDVPPAT